MIWKFRLPGGVGVGSVGSYMHLGRGKCKCKDCLLKAKIFNFSTIITSISYMHTHTPTHPHTHTHSHTHIHTHTYIHTYIHTYTLTHTLIHTHTLTHTHTHSHTHTYIWILDNSTNRIFHQFTFDKVWS